MSIAVLCLTAANFLVLANTEADTDETMIRAILTAHSQAWAAKDVTALVKSYAENADHVSSSGEYTAGKKAIAEKYNKLFASGRFNGVTSKHAIMRVNLVHPNVAVVDATWASSGMKDANGNLLPERQGMSTLVLVKENDAWKTVSLRAAVPNKSQNK